MAEIKISAGGAKKQIDDVTKAIDATAKATDAANKKPLRVLAPGTIDELKEAIRLQKELINLQRTSVGSGSGPAIPGIGMEPSAPTSQGIPPNHKPPHSSQVGSGHKGGGGRWSNYGNRGIGGRAVGAFTGGVGGATSTIANEAMGGSGFLKGGLIGAGLFAAYKAGSALSEGYDRAKSRAIDLDTLKRTMGDLNVSFGILKAASDAAGQGMGINSNEAVKMAVELNRLSGGFKSESSLFEAVHSSAGFGRAYGVGAGEFGQYAAGQKYMGSDQSSRQLALQIGEVIAKTGMNARVPELLQAMSAFSTATNRVSLGAPNMEGWGGAFSGMMHTGIRGLTSDSAMGILGQANAAMMQGGGKGEASMNFAMAAYNRQGKLNPIQASMLSEGGLFGTRNQAFGAGSPYEVWMGKGFGAGLIGAEGNKTNLQSIMEHMMRSGQTRELMLDSIKGMFGLSSLSQAAAFAAMKPEAMGATGNLLKNSGIDISNVKDSGINTLSNIATAKNMNDLLGISSGMKLSKDETGTITGKSFEDTQKALAQIAAGKEQQDTQGSLIIKGEADIQTEITRLGDKLLGPTQMIRDTLLVMAKKTEGGIAGAVAEMRAQEVRDSYQPEIDRLSAPMTVGRGALPKSYADPRQKQLDTLKHRMGLEEIDARLGIPKGVSWGIERAESSGGTNLGADGYFGLTSGVRKEFGVKLGDYDSEKSGYEKEMHKLITRNHGNLRAALKEYNSVNPDYYNNVMKYGGVYNDSDAMAPDGAMAQGGSQQLSVNVNGQLEVTHPDKSTEFVPLTATTNGIPRGAGAVRH